MRKNLWLMIYIIIAVSGLIFGMVKEVKDSELPNSIVEYPNNNVNINYFSNIIINTIRLFLHNFQLLIFVILLSFVGFHFYFIFINMQGIGWLVLLFMNGTIYLNKLIYVFPVAILEMTMWVIVVYYSHKIFTKFLMFNNINESKKEFGESFIMLINIGIPLVLIGAFVEALAILILSL